MGSLLHKHNNIIGGVEQDLSESVDGNWFLEGQALRPTFVMSFCHMYIYRPLGLLEQHDKRKVWHDLCNILGEHLK